MEMIGFLFLLHVNMKRLFATNDNIALCHIPDTELSGEAKHEILEGKQEITTGPNVVHCHSRKEIEITFLENESGKLISFNFFWRMNFIFGNCASLLLEVITERLPNET